MRNWRLEENNLELQILGIKVENEKDRFWRFYNEGYDLIAKDSAKRLISLKNQYKGMVKVLKMGEEKHGF